MLKGDLSLRNGRGPTGEVSKVALVTLLHDSIFPEQEPESSQKKWEATGWAATPTSGRGRGWSPGGPGRAGVHRPPARPVGRERVGWACPTGSNPPAGRHSGRVTAPPWVGALSMTGRASGAGTARRGWRGRPAVSHCCTGCTAAMASWPLEPRQQRATLLASQIRGHPAAQQQRSPHNQSLL